MNQLTREQAVAGVMATNQWLSDLHAGLSKILDHYDEFATAHAAGELGDFFARLQLSEPETSEGSSKHPTPS